MKNSMSVIFVCQIIPDELLTKYPVSPAQTIFCSKIIATGYFDKVVSLVQTNVQPYMVNEIKDDGGIEYIQTRLFPQNKITRLINNIIENIRVVKSCGDSEIIYNNINRQTFLSCIINKIVLRRRVFAIITDHTPSCRPMTFQWLMEKLYSKLDGVVTLSSRFNIDNTNRYSIAGIISEEIIRKENLCEGKTQSVLFSGALTDVTGIRLALETFSEMPEIELHVTGRGPLAEIVSDYASKYKNIIFHGFVESDEYQKLLKNSSICLSLRDPNLPENSNNFPSKLLEYLSFGKIVISTINYPELEGISYYICSFTKQDLRRTLSYLMEATDEHKTSLNANYSMLMSRFSKQAWIEVFDKMRLQ